MLSAKIYKLFVCTIYDVRSIEFLIKKIFTKSEPINFHNYDF